MEDTENICIEETYLFLKSEVSPIPGLLSNDALFCNPLSLSSCICLCLLPQSLGKRYFPIKPTVDLNYVY